jgi:hypothetical protein
MFSRKDKDFCDQVFRVVYGTQHTRTFNRKTTKDFVGQLPD